MTDTVIISRERYQSLLEDELFLLCLQDAGVDNWEWFDEAVSDYQEAVKDLVWPEAT